MVVVFSIQISHFDSCISKVSGKSPFHCMVTTSCYMHKYIIKI